LQGKGHDGAAQNLYLHVPWFNDGDSGGHNSVNPTREEIKEYVLATMQELCRDWDYSRPVGPSSRLFTELGLESLDAVVLGTIIQEHFQKPLPFAELLADIGREQRDLSIDELVDFVDQHLNRVQLETEPTGSVQ
jgi:acyl carrier protein